MRVLLTGHLGFIGPAVVTALRAAQHEVVGLDSGLFVDGRLEQATPPIETIVRDLRDVTVDDVRGFDAVVHLAGVSNDPLGFLDPALTHEINVTATVRLASMAREAGVQRFLNSSSCSVYGATEEPWVDETTTPRPVTPYGESKIAGEQGLVALASPSFCVVSHRNATAFGYSPHLRTDVVVNDLAAGAFLSGEIRLNSDGSAWRPLVHIKDIAQAFTLSLSAPAESVNGQIFNVGADDQNYTVKEIAGTVADEVAGARLSLVEGAGPDLRSYRVRFVKLGQLLPNFRCRYNLRAGIADLVANYQRLGLQSTKGCVRLIELQRLIDTKDVDGTLRPSEARRQHVMAVIAAGQGSHRDGEDGAVAAKTTAVAAGAGRS